MTYSLIAGVDEVGLGCLAGPLFAAAVIIDPRKRIYKLKDSKLLSAKQREQLFKKIYERALAVSIGRVEVEEIDRLNLYYANLLAMERALLGLPIKPDLVLIDGRAKPKMDLTMQTIIDGDETENCIRAASIIAKVSRDKEMLRLSEQFPQYRFDKHKGYATREHRILLKQYGPCALHRQAFIKPKWQLSTVQMERGFYHWLSETCTVT